MTDAPRHWLRRTDVRASGVIALVLLVGIAVQSALLYAFVATEALEQGDAWVGHALRSVSREIRSGGDPTVALAELEHSQEGAHSVARLTSPIGERSAWGIWPEDGIATLAATTEHPHPLAALRLLRPGNYRVGRANLGALGTLEVAVSLEHFAAEAREIGRGLLLIAVVSSVLALGVAVGATLWAFAPLRSATRLLEQIGPQRLGERLPMRGTSDPIDRHARLLNQLLGEVAASFARLRAFSSDVAHEFRTPLNRIATVADVARDGSADEAREALASISATTGELNRVVEALLLIAEVEDARSPIRFEPIEVDSRVAKAIALYEPAFAERGSRVRVDLSAIAVDGVPTLFDRVIVNLLENALQHTEPGSDVEVSCRLSEGGARIAVDDAGDGIADRDREAIFERFTRIASGGAPEPGARIGHGLGLALAQSIAGLHGGALRVETSHLGGARFVWWIPAHTPDR